MMQVFYIRSHFVLSCVVQFLTWLMNVETKEQGAICDAIASLSKAVVICQPAIRSVMKTAEVGKSVSRAAACALVLNARGGRFARSSSTQLLSC